MWAELERDHGVSSNLAWCYYKLGRFSKAIELFQRCKAKYPMSNDFLNNVALSFRASGKKKEAVTLLKQAARSQPDNLLYKFNLAETYLEAATYNLARKEFESILSIYPNHPEVLISYSACLIKLGQSDRASVLLSDLVRSDSLNYRLWQNLGICQVELLDYSGAERSLVKAHQLNPNSDEITFALIDAKLKNAKHKSALDDCKNLKNKNPHESRYWALEADILAKLGDHEGSSSSFYTASKLSKTTDFLLGKALHQNMRACSWATYQDNLDALLKMVNKGRKVAEPFGFQALCQSEHLLKTCATLYYDANWPSAKQHLFVRKKVNEKIKVAYISGEFRQHATALLLVGVIESHNKSQFSVYALDNGFDDNSPLRKRLNEAFDKTFFIGQSSDDEVLKLCKDLEIDIAVNLNGFFGEGRNGVFSKRVAPIQINYLGFPGTLGSSCMDYIIADSVVVPRASAIHYSEKIIWLPDCYQPNDRQRTKERVHFANRPKPRQVLFGCLNNNYKITPEIFKCWMKILSSVPGSKLKLLSDNEQAKKNLTQEAKNLDVNPDRLVFVCRTSYDHYLLELAELDLFLDTFPYNAHTTASDALWVSVPILTLEGSTFPSRVGKSLLRTLGMEHMVTQSYQAYIDLAIKYGSNFEALDELRFDVNERVDSSSLFDCRAYCSHLEEAFQTVYRRYAAGKRPDHIIL